MRSDFTDQQFRQLVLSIRATIGIEAIVWLVDVAGLSRDDAVALDAVVRTGIAGTGRRPSRPQRRGCRRRSVPFGNCRAMGTNR